MFLEGKSVPSFLVNAPPASPLIVEDWVEEAHASIRIRHMSSIDQAHFLYDHLEEAKSEIKYCSQGEREDPEQIFKILFDLYGCSQSYAGLQWQFFECKQCENESV